MAEILRCNAASGAYDITIGKGVWEKFASFPGRKLLVRDGNVPNPGIEADGEIVLTPGEQYKTIAAVESTKGRAEDAGMEKSGRIITAANKLQKNFTSPRFMLTPFPRSTLLPDPLRSDSEAPPRNQIFSLPAKNGGRIPLRFGHTDLPKNPANGSRP